MPDGCRVPNPPTFDPVDAPQDPPKLSAGVAKGRIGELLQDGGKRPALHLLLNRHFLGPPPDLALSREVDPGNGASGLSDLLNRPGLGRNADIAPKAEPHDDGLIAFHTHLMDFVVAAQEDVEFSYKLSAKRSANQAADRSIRCAELQGIFLGMT